MAQKKQRFFGLEWLRFLFGLYIVIFHTLHAYPSIRSWSGYITDIGFFSTSAFFVLSGFLLAHVYIDQGQRLREPAKSFWIKRFSNLYPIHIGSLLLAMLVSALVGYLGIAPGDEAISLRFVVFDVNDGTAQLDPESLHHVMDNGELALNLFLNITLLHAWNPLYLTFNPPSWSISVLFFFYLTFPWVAPRLFRVKSLRWALVLTHVAYLVPPLLVIALTDYAMPETGILHRNPLIRLPEFIAGILLCVLYTRYTQEQRPFPAGFQKIALLFVATSVLIGSLLLRHHGHEWYYLLHNGLWLPAQLALILVIARWNPSSSARMRRLASRLGGASLPMFALHVPLFALFTRLERVLAGEPGACLSSIPQCLEAAGEISLWFYPLFLLITVLFCVKFQEVFVVRLRNRLQGMLLPTRPIRKTGKNLSN